MTSAETMAERVRLTEKGVRATTRETSGNGGING